MKRITLVVSSIVSIVLLVFLWMFYGSAKEIRRLQGKYYDPLLVVVLMVKDEEAVMRDTLKPFLDAGLQHYVVLDTGSTDNTIGVTQQAFQDYGVEHGHIIEQPFVDFSTSRNYAIEQTEKLFPYAGFIMMIDAEWYVHNVEGLLQYCKDHYDDECDAFFIDCIEGNTTKSFHSLFKAHRGVRYEGVVYEILNVGFNATVPSDMYIVYNPSNYGLKKSRERYYKDIKALQKELENKPNHPRTLYYLGHVNMCINELEDACYWYKKRCEVSGWEEEDYLARYDLGVLHEQRGDWDEAINYYMQAYEYRTSRVEPLIKIAEYYFNQKDFERAYLFALQAVSLPISCDGTCIDKSSYTFERYNLLTKIIRGAEQVENGRQALNETLKYYSEILSLKEG